MPDPTLVGMQTGRRLQMLHMQPILPATVQKQLLLARTALSHHAAVLTAMGITDLALLGRLEVSGTITPQPGLLRGPLSAAEFTSQLMRPRPFSGAHRICPPVHDQANIERFGGVTREIRGAVIRAPQGNRPGARKNIEAPLLTPLTGVLEIPVAYWAAQWIEIADDTTVVLMQPNHWLVMIAEKITIGQNVNITWAQQPLGIPQKPDSCEPLPSPGTSIYMEGADGAPGADGRPGGNGFTGDVGAEVEIWTLDINRLPTILLQGQDGGTGGPGGDGQAGQDGARGRSWEAQPYTGGSVCKSGPGDGGNGGRGGNGGVGGKGGSGGHGGRFGLFAPTAQVQAVTASGFYIDASPGVGGVGGAGGMGGAGGSGGTKGHDRPNVGCPTNYGHDGASGAAGSPGVAGSMGKAGDLFQDAVRIVVIDPTDFRNSLTKPAILSLSRAEAVVGDSVTANGQRFSMTDVVMVGGVKATTQIVSDTLLSFVIPSIEGGRQKSVEVKQQDGTRSNAATLAIQPIIHYAEQNGKKSIDRPSPRFTPGQNVKLVGAGFSPGAAVKVATETVVATFISATQVEFSLTRPAATPSSLDGEPVTVSVVLADGTTSIAITLVLDTVLIVVFGDSIQWGQGLRDEVKFTTSVMAELRAKHGGMGIYREVFAHSGAIIGAGDPTQMEPIDGEVPTSYPTILHQIDLYTGNREAVDYVLIDGGINDIGVNAIVAPWDTTDFATQARDYCYRDMKTLLTKVLQTFSTAKVIVTGYYAIVSDDSDMAFLGLLLGGLGLATAGPVGMVVGAGVSQAAKNLMVQRSQTFATEANRALEDAVNQVNTTLPAARVKFADPAFGTMNAIFAPQSWIWGIDADLSAADDEPDGGVAPSRCTLCDANSDRTDLFRCHRASMGHPNKDGAKAYAAAVLAKL